MNLYLTAVVDQLFKPDELPNINVYDLQKDDRFNLAKEAVRSKYELDDHNMNFEWPSLRETFLQKRRNLKTKFRKTT
ncbi:unnamed protein product [Didymodactylos carnosus]|uniref:Uncharacterized protein n=1 Tax=Didymodactylos carnosus TaxID=1234261 RepID=A0A814K8B4_9BILA|nr:unnamed protein product [Didymodactylos carnosus]CAF1073466.1 unnamed protein product [Didymodactylos carnosus]CAF3815917.1 unnamed protein product [Didymodactylos carnosus]CAF3837516.1 unnamed protein product [Didymodactylos carnosus]